MELEDKIGRDDVVNKICTLVDRLQKDANFCLALDGAWGSGKSFVMQMLAQKFNERPEYIVIKYDAWKNNFYSDPLIAILYCLLDGIKEYLYLLPEIQEKIKKGMKKNLQSWGNGVLKALKSCGGKIALLGYAIEGIKNIVTAAGNLTNHEKLADFRSYQSLLDETKKKLNEITESEIYEGRQTKLIILVDEIDRCLPNEQLIVLERLHHLFEIKNCAVIVAINKASVESVFERSYGEGNKTYFRKFFDYNFKLIMAYQIFLNNLISDCVDDLNENLPATNLLEKQDADYLAQCIGKWCADHGNFDNRECERLVKAAKAICKNVLQGAMNYGYLWFIFKMTFEKMYGSQFNVFKNGTSSSFYYVDEFDYMVKPLNVIATMPYGMVNIPIYNDLKINNLTYMLNQFAQRNNDKAISSISSLWCFNYNVKAICGRDGLEKIIGWIDCYKE